ncbi:MAG TPA: prephenate dehydrogenase [Actinobacteria bacterium]|nr:prephenate dehydrogenase [Actinomycetota bacterium]
MSSVRRPEAARPAVPARVAVIGAGLIGTSVALALRERGASVWLADQDPAAARLAEHIGAGRVLPAAGVPGGPADIAVLAVPPAAVAPELARWQQRELARCYTDVASVKELPLAQARRAGCDLASFVAGHPLSGRERSGPAAARADLFLGRTWVICPSAESSPDAVAAVTALVAACGAQLAAMSAAEHDRCAALVSHVPHLLAVAMASRLEQAPDAALALAGQGVRDVTRIAASDPALWTQILGANAGPVAEMLEQLATELAGAAAALTGLSEGDDAGRKQLIDLLERGNAGVARIPGKRGGPAPDYTIVQVVIPDQPGELARLFQAAGEAGINIEDVAIEHSPGLPAGVAELSVRPEAATRLTDALAAGGWPVRR